MPKFVDLIGQRFGKLVVVERLPNLRRNATRFMCQCDCGEFIPRLASSLKRGLATSCGCGRELEQSEGAFRALYRARKHDAQVVRNLVWDISEEYFRSIVEQSCHYCGDEPYQIYQPSRKMGGYVYNGIDRVDNTLGYIEGNCVPCCGVCNYMKSATSVDDFRSWVIQVYNHWASK